MAEEIDPEPQNVEWVSLTKAFNDVGRMKFGADWDEGTIYLSEGRFRNNMWDEGLPVRIDYSAKYSHPEEWRGILDSLVEADVNFASEEMITHYDKTVDILLTGIWDGKIKVEAINSDGDLSRVPRKAWKNKKKAFEISFPDSEVSNLEEEGSRETWKIRVDLNDLQNFLDRNGEISEEVSAVKNAHQKPPAAVEEGFGKFPSPPNLEWDEVTIIFFQDDAVKIKARDIEKKYMYAEMGFKDGRRGDVPNSRWKVLRDGFAVNGGAITWNEKISKKGRDNLPKFASDIARTLKTFFGAAESPFFRYRSDRGYKLKLNLLDHRLKEVQEQQTPDNGLPSPENKSLLTAEADLLLEEDGHDGRAFNPKDLDDY